MIGTTIISECFSQRDDNPNFSCNRSHTVGTVARITCKGQYSLPKDAKYDQQILTCLSSGSWDQVTVRCVPLCGRVTQVSTPYVVGGRRAKNVAEVPWSAAIYKRNNLICGGTIISERLVISAAHCFFREQPSNSQENVVLEDLSLFKVAVGKYFRNINAEESSKPQFLGISDVFSIPGYDG